MLSNPNKVSRFWQELKRRKVVRVITVYAAAAFVILELVSIIVEPLKLPEWTLPMIIVLLCIGFIIAVILSWVYDVTPEGIEKTKSAQKVKEVDKPVSSNIWRIASYISFVVIVGLIVLNIIPRSHRSDIKEILDKSIAVLPFINDSPDEENAYFINGIMEEIILNLQAIKDLRVPGRTSIEQYRNPTKSIPEIAKELDVNFIVEASGQKYGNTFVLRVQLLEGETDKHLWGESYEQEIIGSPEVLIRIQSGIAESIAAELQAVITPEEKQLIEKAPTSSLTAYDFYQRGREEYYKFWLDRNNIEALKRAEDLYYNALEYDSTFATAYIGLANVYRGKHYWETFFTENFLDSVLILADIALSYDDQLADAYVTRGNYYRENSNKELALKEYEKAIKINPNNYEACWNIGWLYMLDDNVKAISNLQKAASLHRGQDLPRIFGNISSAYGIAGFKEKAIYYANERLKLDYDSASYYLSLAKNEEFECNFEKAIEFLEKSYAIDSTRISTIFFLGLYHSFHDQFKESLEYMKQYDSVLKTLGQPDPDWFYRVGFAYWVNGFKEEWKYYINTSLEQLNSVISLGRYVLYDHYTYYHLAAIYAFLGEKDKAYDNLRQINNRQRMPIYLISNFKVDPMFESLRDEPEFQQILVDIEAKNQAEHERVRKWLEEYNLL